MAKEVFFKVIHAMGLNTSLEYRSFEEMYLKDKSFVVFLLFMGALTCFSMVVGLLWSGYFSYPIIRQQLRAKCFRSSQVPQNENSKNASFIALHEVRKGSSSNGGKGNGLVPVDALTPLNTE